MTRAEELAAIAAYIATKGVTHCPTAHASADLSFISLFRNRERAGVKHEPSDTEALQRRIHRQSTADRDARHAMQRRFAEMRLQ